MFVKTNESGTLSVDSPTITETYVVDASLVAIVANAFFGRRQPNGSFWVPAQAANYPGLFCTSVSYSPFNKVGSVPQLWQLEIQYGRYENDQQQEGGVDYGSISVGVSVDAITLSNGAVEWDGGPDDGQAIDADNIKPTKLIRQIEIELSYNNVPYIDYEGLANNAMKVNSGTFLGFSAETVLFVGPRMQKPLTNNGTDVWNLTYSLTVRPDGWNKNLHEETMTWYAITPKPYQTANLENVLFYA